MKIEIFGKIYVALMSVYFIISGLNALLDIDSKLTRIGLTANDLDGKIAFILIYCSLMVGIGVAIALIAYFSKSWFYSALLATTIICSFIAFRLVGSMMIGMITNVQLSYILLEIVEVGVGILLLTKSNVVTSTPN